MSKPPPPKNPRRAAGRPASAPGATAPKPAARRIPEPAPDDELLLDTVEVDAHEGPQAAAGRPAAQTAFRPGQTREATDTLDARFDLHRRRERERRERQAGKPLTTNRFMNRQYESFPPLPADDEEWHYGWRRYRFGAVEDTKNMHSALHTSGLGWELLRADMLPDYERGALQMFANVEGKYGGYIVHNDVIAARCPIHIYREWEEFMQEQARSKIRETKRDFAQTARSSGFTPRLEEDVDTMDPSNMDEY